jgi:hypothetical protein
LVKDATLRLLQEELGFRTAVREGYRDPTMRKLYGDICVLKLCWLGKLALIR